MQQMDIDLCWWRINEGGEICECVLFFYVYSVKKRCIVRIFLTVLFHRVPKREKWIEDIDAISNIAKDEPQAAYASYTKAISHRWTYVQRTISNIGNLFAPLESTIREKLIPALIGRSVSDEERKVISLPVRLGGLGIANPTLTAEHEFTASISITRNLTNIILNQESNFINYDKVEVAKTIQQVKKMKEARLKEDAACLYNTLNDNMKRILDLAQEKGAGAWLTTTPIQSLGFALNKQEFRDAVWLWLAGPKHT